MTNNTVYTNTGSYGVLTAATVGPLVQYQAGVVMRLTLLGLDGVAVDLTGRTITGTLTNSDTGTTSDITGAIAVDGDAPEDGLFSWTTSAADVASAGTFAVIFSAAELDVITFPAHLAIIEYEAAV